MGWRDEVSGQCWQVCIGLTDLVRLLESAKRGCVTGLDIQPCAVDQLLLVNKFRNGISVFGIYQRESGIRGCTQRKGRGKSLETA